MKASTKKMKHDATATPPHMEDEVENVEYLEECVTDDIEEVGENSAAHRSADMEIIFKDTFYPNAVQCLLTLYRHKYDQQMNDRHDVQTMYNSIWDDISKDMSESYFQFNADQVKHKFTQLRQQYFAVSSKTEAEKFEYFHYFHDMYGDKVISVLLGGDSAPVHNANQLTQCIYRDNLLFDDTEIHEAPNNQKQTDEIAHKEHEFINMVERELKAMANESSTAKLTTEPLHNDTPQKLEREDSIEADILTKHASKRPYVNDTTSPLSVTLKKPESAELTQSNTNMEVSNVNKCEMTLADYNEAQQRRHEEKMNLFRQTLLLQERTIEVQNKLLEQLIKRV
ncbi:PREDICTED: uncharacterized protein LOC108353986 [Rhagoletis zephyria]|uniref:uncharacterized protein LOC108353986 n=1 Tax=Rhagoletis zephyria TaxID=28612 RepID=UPI00081157C0|nr:PREDICTED: uncharacterized protein LOC108353986 [Rhagoletis zephyria]